MHHIVGRQRTGTTLLGEYVRNFIGPENFYSSEFFLDNWEIDSNGKIKQNQKESTNFIISQLERKFNFLEILKDENRLPSFKIFPYHLIRLGYKERLYNLLQDLKLLTVKRDPFDTFLSVSYQNKTEWKIRHKKTADKDQIIQLKSFYINDFEIKKYVKEWKIEEEFMLRLNFFHEFEYSDINTQHLRNFFNVNFNEFHSPLNVDYRSLVINIHEVEDFFIKEFYK